MMLFDRVNLQDKLEEFRNKAISEEEILEQLQRILSREKVELISDVAQEDGNNWNNFVFDKLEASRIFHISQIKKLCITYRLRFLETRFFKFPLPSEACREIKHLNREHQIRLQGFRIMAPTKYYKLMNADDPILFAPIGYDYYYLIHKWGNDLHPLRKLLMWPFRSFETLGFFIILFSLLAAVIFRELFYSQHRATSEFIMLYLFSLKSLFGIIFFYGIALGKNFSSAIWNSRYFNS